MRIHKKLHRSSQRHIQVTYDQKITIFGIQCKYGYMYIIQSLPLIHIILNVETIWEEVISIHSYHETFSKWFYPCTFILPSFAFTICIVHIQIHELFTNAKSATPIFFLHYSSILYSLCVHHKWLFFFAIALFVRN